MDLEIRSYTKLAECKQIYQYGSPFRSDLDLKSWLKDGVTKILWANCWRVHKIGFGVSFEDLELSTMLTIMIWKFQKCYRDY